MAIEGSYDQGSFTPKDPFRLWAESQGIGLYWDTENQFASGKPAPRARARSVNYIGSPRTLSFGGRNYGAQSIDRNEWQRLGSVAVPTVSAMLQSREQGVRQRTSSTGSTPPGVPTPPATMAGRLAQRWRQRNTPQPPQNLNMGLPQGIPTPPQPGEAPPLPRPTMTKQQPSWVTTPPTGPTPSPLATSNWREEQAQRIAEWELGEPGQPTPDVTLGSRTYQQERAQAREARATAPSEPEVGMPTSAERRARARQLQVERELARGNAPRNRNLPGSVASGRSASMPQNAPFEQPTPEPRPGSIGTVPITLPISSVGGQEERLSAEGVTPPKRTRKKNA